MCWQIDGNNKKHLAIEMSEIDELVKKLIG